MIDLVYEIFVSNFVEFFNLPHGADGFTSPLKEGMVGISIALKNPPPLPGLNPRTLCSMAGTLTTAPPKQLNVCISGRSLFSTVVRPVPNNIHMAFKY
jgi:hypothetical protein